MAIALALAAALSWGCADFIGGLASRRLGALTVVLLVELGGLIVMSIVCLILRPPMLDMPEAAMAAGAGLVGVTGLALFYRAMAIGTMSVVAPITASGVALPVIVGIASGERPSALAAAGLALVVVGVMLASREQSEVHAEAAVARQSIVLALVAAFCFGGFFALIDRPAEESVAWTVWLVRAGPVPILILLWLVKGAERPPRRLGLGLMAAGTIDLIATSLIALASSEGDLSVVSVVSSMYPVVTVMLAALILHERLLRSQYVGVALALIGIGAVAGG